ncbi:MAG: T9SS type A sorting domain-containing protein [Bacteroidetes bacterium]|nr:T9SS type A sorting domain-containing protein [Bacteroidota bacterium]
MKKALMLTHKEVKGNKRCSTLQFAIGFILLITTILPDSVTAGSKISIASGNWENPAIWNPAGIPAAGDNVVIGNSTTIVTTGNTSVQNLSVFQSGNLTLGQGTRMTIAGNITINGRMNMNKGLITISSTGRPFKIAAGGTFIWDPNINTSAEATLFTSCTENFEINSNLIIKNWYNYTIPLGEKVNGNFGNLEINTPGGNNSIVEWNQNNLFESHKIFGTLTIDQGWVTLDKSGSISNTTIGNIELKNVNSVFYAHNGTHTGSFNLHCSNIANNGGVFYGLNDGDGNVTIHVVGNFYNTGNVKIINNTGIPNVSNGNATLNIEGTFTQNTGDTRILYNIATINSGIFNATIGELSLNGGIFMGQTACHTNGLVSTLNVLRNFTINFQNANDKFRGTSLSSISGTLNNIKLKLNVGGNFIVNGIQSAEVTSSAASGNEEITIQGNYEINGCNNSLNYGSLIASHNLQLNVNTCLKMNGGILALSKNFGSLNSTIENMIIAGGTLSVKNNQGSANIEIARDFTQTGGDFIFHHNITTPSIDNISVAISGIFTQSGGTINLDNNIQSTSNENILRFKGNAVNFSGTGKIMRSGGGNSNVFGSISYQSPKFLKYTRSGTSQTIENVIQRIESGSKVIVKDCNFQLASNNQSGINMLHIKTNGTLSLSKGQISSNQQFGFSRLFVDSGGTISISNPFGFYDQTSRSSINSTANLNYELHPNSIVEYTGSESMVLTGMPNANNYENSKYGILKVNLQGSSSPCASVSNNFVFVRTKLDLISGGIKLNANTITIENGSPEAIKRTKGFIISEGSTPINNTIVCWKKLSAGAHEIPFGITADKIFPVIFKITTGLGKDIYVSTRKTNKDNTPYPALNMTFPGGSPFAVEHVVDRWWSFTGEGIKADVTLTYLGEENTLASTMSTGPLKIIQWTGTGWNITNAIASGVKNGKGSITMNNTMLQPDWTIASVITASIDLSARLIEDGVSVDWHIQSETGIEKFVVERSADGINFNEIDEIKASFDSKIRDYTYDDKTYTGTESYYRLKQIAPDGSFIYSKIVMVESKSVSSGMRINSIAPNPFSNVMRLSLKSDINQKSKVLLISSDGKTKYQKEYQLEIGENSVEINNLESLEPGTYILIVESLNDRLTKKVIKN